MGSFSAYHVLANEDLPASTNVSGDHAVQRGTYRQKVVTPEGRTLEVSGTFMFEWRRTSSGEWDIARVTTFSSD